MCLSLRAVARNDMSESQAEISRCLSGGGAEEQSRAQGQHVQRPWAGMRLMMWEQLADYCGGSLVEGESVNCVALNETREVYRLFRAVKDSGLYLKMVGRPLNRFKQRNDMILDRKATGYCLNCPMWLSLCWNMERCGEWNSDFRNSLERE